MRAALPGSNQGNRRIAPAPSQNPKGPSAVMGLPNRLGKNQSCKWPWANVHMTPKPAASSFFQGSRPKRPKAAYTTHMASSAARGKGRVAEAVSRTTD